MAKHILNDVTIRNAKPEDKRLNDGGGLYLLIKPNCAKWWRYHAPYTKENFYRSALHFAG